MRGASRAILPFVRFWVLVWILAGCGRISFESRGTSDGAAGDAVADPDAVDLPDAFVEANRVFVSSPISPVGDPSAFNARCQADAAAAGLPGTFVAYISTGGLGARARLAGARGFVRIDGLIVADQPANIPLGMLRPVAFYADGTTVPDTVAVMTGTNAMGTEAGNCNGYTLPNGVIDSGVATGTLDDFSTAVQVPCNVAHPVYCFQIDHDVALAEPVATGRHVFVTDTAGQLSAGLTAADARCALAASNGGLATATTFKALLATDGASAASRFNSQGANWVRLDGVPVASTPSDFLAGAWRAPIHVRLGGAYARVPVLVGAADINAPGTAASTCNSWTVVNATTPTMGISSAVPPRAFTNPTYMQRCDDGGRLYCVEE